MSKFRVGDRVIRAAEDFGLVKEGDIRLVTGLNNNGDLKLDNDDSYKYNPDYFVLCPDGCVEGEPNTLDILTPLKVAEAFLNGDEVQGLSEDGERWHDVTYPITLSFSVIQNQKFRHKPKTIVINGVEVPAPCVDTGRFKVIYEVDVTKKRVVQSTRSITIAKEINYWATKEDAQQVLDAMLIPFKQL